MDKEVEVLHTYQDHVFNLGAAGEIVPYIMSFYKPESVVDVGCGLGTWAYTYKKNGIKKVIGVDGTHVPKEKIYLDLNDFKEVDLREMEKINLGKFDMVHCLEVAEHLPEERADDFVEFLTSMSDVLVFSAAIKDQGGENHINEQYPKYWEEKFEKRGYVFLDAFREKFWQNEKVDWWYKQNMFLVVKKELQDKFDFPKWSGNVYITPELYEYRMEQLKNVKQ